MTPGLGSHTRRGHLRWCLLVDFAPADVGLAVRIAAAVEALVKAERGETT